MPTPIHAMITERPVQLPEARLLLRSLFPDERPLRPQDHGCWQGSAKPLLQLSDPVRLNTLANFLQGRSAAGIHTLVPDQDPQRIVAWHITFTLPAGLTALPDSPGDPKRPSIVTAHTEAVFNTLARLEESLICPESGPPWSPRAAFAVFRGTPGDRDALPLRTTVLLPNLGFHDGGPATLIDPQSVRQGVDELEAFYHRRLLEHLAAPVKDATPPAPHTAGSRLTSHSRRHLRKQGRSR